MERQEVVENKQPSFIDGVAPDPLLLEALTRSIYSAELCAIVDDSLNADPATRPTVEALKVQVDAKLSSAEWATDRQGVIGAEDDILLLPNYPVKLKWATRIMNGAGGVNAPRVPRAPNSETSTEYSNSDDGDA